jgi:hypothetical protein
MVPTKIVGTILKGTAEKSMQCLGRSSMGKSWEIPWPDDGISSTCTSVFLRDAGLVAVRVRPHTETKLHPVSSCSAFFKGGRGSSLRLRCVEVGCSQFASVPRQNLHKNRD